MWVQNLSPYKDSYDCSDSPASVLASGVAAGGPWQAILVNATSLVILSDSFPSVTLPYVLNTDSVGVSEKAHIESEKSVFVFLFNYFFQYVNYVQVTCLFGISH